MRFRSGTETRCFMGLGVRVMKYKTVAETPPTANAEAKGWSLMKFMKEGYAFVAIISKCKFF